MPVLQSENLYEPKSIRTYSGRYINLLEPDPEDILIEDIAQGLAYTYRFCGHMQKPITVAQHSLYVCNLLLELTGNYEMAICGLLHDAPEAYLADIPGPIKSEFTRFREVEQGIYEAIALKFNLPKNIPKEVKECDTKALQHEWDEYVLSDSDDWMDFHPKYAKRRFIECFNVFYTP